MSASRLAEFRLTVFSAHCETGCTATAAVAVDRACGLDSPYLAGRVLTMRGWVCTGPKGSTKWICPQCWARRLSLRQSTGDLNLYENNLRGAAVIAVAEAA